MLCQTQPSGPGFPDENNLKLYAELIHAAKQKLTIANPYFVPDDSLMTAMTTVAERGVDVTLICYDKSVVAAMQPVFESYLKRSRQVHLHEWATRPIMARLAENLSLAVIQLAPGCQTRQRSCPGEVRRRSR